MVAKISVGNSLYGALAYNGEKINEAQGRLLTTNRIYNDGSGTVDINKAMEGFHTFLPPQMKVEKPVVHISLNPHPDDMELQNIAREYLEKLGFGNQPYLVFKHEDIDRHHLHIVTVRVDENGKCISDKNNYYRSKQITRELEKKYELSLRFLCFAHGWHVYRNGHLPACGYILRSLQYRHGRNVTFHIHI